MPEANFKLHRIRIEGFKAFAAPQLIEIGNHVFVFGRNGLGKSSVVEAIRWCLFGLADRPAAEVRNAFYSNGDCKVELELQGPDGIWTILRRLRTGSSGKSDLTILNPSGAKEDLTTVFPHFARLGPREGTHIIFASQQSSHRRPQADITNFDRVLYSYLQIENVPDLLNRLSRELEEQSVIERQLAQDLDNAEESLRTKIKNLSSRIDEILATAPWPGSSVPTNAETKSRIRAFVEDCGGNLVRPDGAPVTRGWLLKEAARAIEELSTATEHDMQERLTAAEKSLHEYATTKQTFEALNEKLTRAQNAVDSCKQELRNNLGTTTKQKLLDDCEEFERQNTKQADYITLVQQAERYVDEFSPEDCPVCDTSIERTKLLSGLQRKIVSGLGSAEIAEALTKIRAKLKAVEAAELALDEAKAAHRAVESETATARTKLEKVLGGPIDPSSSQQEMERLADRFTQLERDLAVSGSHMETKRETLKNLQAEARLHIYRKRRERLRHKLESGLQPTRDTLAEFADVLQALRAIKEALQESFNKTLDGTLPRISELMTDVFGRLTHQASFPKIVVRSSPTDAERTLRVHVTSNRTPGQFFKPAEVLNGQAVNALNLVPYFVFSKFQAEALELDCLLIDDPSQSFDTSRVELLMRELKTAAKHAQLIVASHEENRFAPIIGKYFKPGSYRLLHVTAFDPEVGPTLECVE